MPATLSFPDRLTAAILEKQTPLVVGLDPRIEQLPEPLKTGPASPDGLARAYEQFCCGVIDAVASLVPAIKPQMAFFEQLGPPGLIALASVVRHARERRLLVLLDGKRGDIGTTAEAYAAAYLGAGDRSPWGGDALTVNPWLGRDTLEPFVRAAVQRDAGIFVLVRTSNPGSGAYQSPMADGLTVAERVARDVEEMAASTAGACGYGAVGAVVGATWPEEMQKLRQAMPSALFLVPGFGAQGGSASDVAAAFDDDGLGAVINSSRAVIFGWEAPSRQHLRGGQWQRAVELAALEAIAQLRDQTPARVLAS